MMTEENPLDSFLWEVISAWPGSVLDYGCGTGRFIEFCSKMGRMIYGADTFEGRYSSWNLQSSASIRIVNQKIQAKDQSFNIVISNQVFEHIPLDGMTAVVSELMRVLAKGGFGIHIFPTKKTVIEPHVGLLGVHWIQSQLLQKIYFIAAYKFGFGYWRSETKRGKLSSKSMEQWVGESMVALNKHTFYHSTKIWRKTFAEQGATVENVSYQLLIYVAPDRLHFALSYAAKFKVLKFLMNYFVQIRIGCILKIEKKLV